MSDIGRTVRSREKTADLIGQVVRSSRGKSVTSIAKLHGGVVNEVFLVATDEERLVMRLNEDSLTVFLKEQWAMTRARERHVQVPEVFDVGEIEGLSFMLMAHAPGVMLSQLSRERDRAFTALGEQTRRIHEVNVEGFGFNLDLSDPLRPRFTETWADLVRGEHEMIFANSSLLEMGALNAQEIAAAIEFLEPMSQWQHPPALCHGDLNLTNVLVDDVGAVTILDWTQTKGGAATLFDLAGMSMKNPSEFEALCLGYGLNASQQEELRSDWQRIALKDVLRAAVWSYSVKHEQFARFAADAQEMYRKVFSA
jgi:fructosamine-3-kinase